MLRRRIIVDLTSIWWNGQISCPIKKSLQIIMFIEGDSLPIQGMNHLSEAILVSLVLFCCACFPLFADIFESLGAPLNVAKPTKASSVFLIHIYVNLTKNDLISFGQAADGAKTASASRIICVDLIAS
uniref:Uncharacterized protein n=1 Tax=Solanum lycopersicum TaxID=4081 RepID=A0A3Q7FHF2_SOLLC